MIRASHLLWSHALALLALLLSASSASSAGGPIVPSGAYGGEGVASADGAVRYMTFDQGRKTLVLKLATDGASMERLRYLSGRWTLPAVTTSGDAGGLAADGSRLVLTASDYRRPTEATRFLLIDGERLVTRARLNLEGTYSFDAISSDGDLMYLVEYEDPRDPLDYRVRAYDLSAGEFLPGEIVDPEEPDERMSGQPIARESSPDGRWAFTLYGGGEETFIHALDTEGATAKCIDLEQFGPRALYNLDMRSDPETGELTVIHKGDVAAHVDPESFEVSVPVGTTIFESPELLLLRLARSIR